MGYYLDTGTGIYKGVIQAQNAGAGSALLLNPNGGPVGIGIAAPTSSLLNVVGSGSTTFATFGPANFSTTLEIQATTSRYANISQNATQSSGSWALRDTTTEGWALGFIASTGASGGVSITRFAPSTAAATTLFNLTSAGKLGINQQTPRAVVDISGARRASSVGRSKYRVACLGRIRGRRHQYRRDLVCLDSGRLYEQCGDAHGVSAPAYRWQRGHRSF